MSLAIDDFGTGQSSLSYIKEFDMATTLKIDKSFVRQMHTGTADQAIVEAIVTMASALDLASWPRASRTRLTSTGCASSACI